MIKNKVEIFNAKMIKLNKFIDKSFIRNKNKSNIIYSIIYKY
jgi:hypothetical protein